jgi:hypothetical protein
MLAKVVTVYLAVLFAYGVVAALIPPRATVNVPARVHPTTLRAGPSLDNAKARLDHAILRDRLAAPEDRDSDGIESDVRDQMKYRPLTPPMT